MLPPWLHLTQSFLTPYQYHPGPDTHPVLSCVKSDRGSCYPPCVPHPIYNLCDIEPALTALIVRYCECTETL